MSGLPPTIHCFDGFFDAGIPGYLTKRLLIAQVEAAARFSAIGEASDVALLFRKPV